MMPRQVLKNAHNHDSLRIKYAQLYTFASFIMGQSSGKIEYPLGCKGVEKFTNGIHDVYAIFMHDSIADEKAHLRGAEYLSHAIFQLGKKWSDVYTPNDDFNLGNIEMDRFTIMYRPVQYNQVEDVILPKTSGNYLIIGYMSTKQKIDDLMTSRGYSMSCIANFPKKRPLAYGQCILGLKEVLVVKDNDRTIAMFGEEHRKMFSDPRFFHNVLKTIVTNIEEKQKPIIMFENIICNFAETSRIINIDKALRHNIFEAMVYVQETSSQKISQAVATMLMQRLNMILEFITSRVEVPYEPINEITSAIWSKLARISLSSYSGEINLDEIKSALVELRAQLMQIDPIRLQKMAEYCIRQMQETADAKDWNSYYTQASTWLMDLNTVALLNKYKAENVILIIGKAHLQNTYHLLWNPAGNTQLSDTTQLRQDDSNVILHKYGDCVDLGEYLGVASESSGISSNINLVSGGAVFMQFLITYGRCALLIVGIVILAYIARDHFSGYKNSTSNTVRESRDLMIFKPFRAYYSEIRAP